MRRFRGAGLARAQTGAFAHLLSLTLLANRTATLSGFLALLASFETTDVGRAASTIAAIGVDRARRPGRAAPRVGHARSEMGHGGAEGAARDEQENRAA
jgi:hypothetical protein